MKGTWWRELRAGRGFWQEQAACFWQEQAACRAEKRCWWREQYECQRERQREKNRFIALRALVDKVEIVLKGGDGSTKDEKKMLALRKQVCVCPCEFPFALPGTSPVRSYLTTYHPCCELQQEHCQTQQHLQPPQDAMAMVTPSESLSCSKLVEQLPKFVCVSVSVSVESS